MAKKTDTKELWHIPKRANVHQTIFMVYILNSAKFKNKAWTRSKQEMLASEMGKAGATRSGRALSHQSVRTHLANLPKYLGFVYLNEETTPPTLVVTEVGRQLIEHHRIEDVEHRDNLKAYSALGEEFTTSEIFAQQMSKLIITNPVINAHCINILLFPFRMTLRLMAELGYLDQEEIGYILFHSKSQDEYELLVEKIKNFRQLDPEQRQREIDAYKKTEEGNLTLVQAPTSAYYMNLCESTGLCERIMVNVNKTSNSKLSAIKIKDSDAASEIIDKYSEVEAYDFGNNTWLWYEYFANPSKDYPPFDIEIKTDHKDELLVHVTRGKITIGGNTLSNTSDPLTLPVFEGEEYRVVAYNLPSCERVWDDTFSPIHGNEEYKIPAIGETKIIERTKEVVATQINEMFSGKYQGFDRDYFTKLRLIEKVFAEDYFHNIYLGGRLEQLFFDLLSILEVQGIIDSVTWYGKSREKFGIGMPAPGGKEGNPDIVFVIEDTTYVLELTTIRGNRAQWNSSEASSVPDHIAKFKSQNTNGDTIGIFSAPSIHPQTQKNLRLNAQEEGVGMIFVDCIELAKKFSELNREEIIKFMSEKESEQLDS